MKLRQAFPSDNLVINFTTFNISGNNYRLIALVDYKYQEVYIHYILTHAEYDQQNRQQDP